MAEWSIAPVLKTGVSQGTVSSNLTPSAMKSFLGVVQRGKGRGRELGFPTANIALPQKNVTGIYAAKAYLKGEAPYMAAVFADPVRGLLEAHLLDFEGNLYDTPMRVELLEKLRDTILYGDEAHLKEAIAEDIARVRKYFKN